MEPVLAAGAAVICPLQGLRAGQQRVWRLGHTSAQRGLPWMSATARPALWSPWRSSNRGRGEHRGGLVARL